MKIKSKIPEPALFLGWDVGGTKSAMITGTSDGRILTRREWPSRAERGPEAMIGDFLIQARTVPEAVAAGVAIGGPLDARNGIVLSPPHLPGWDNIPLKERLQEELGIPVGVEHDAAACGLAEYVWGDFKNCHSLIYLTCGTGFGIGLIIDGKVYHGAAGHSPEIGHARFADEGPVAFGKVGSLEAYCSGTALKLLTQWKTGRSAEPRQVVDLAKAGDSAALEVLRLHAEATGQVCANLADMLFPDVILLGSLNRHLGAPWFEQVQKRFEKEVHPDARHLCKLQGATLAERLQDLSALVIAIQNKGK